MLMRTDPFRDFDRLTDAMFGNLRRPTAMPLDAYRKDDHFYAEFDLPGVDADSIDLTVEQNVLTVRAERKPPAGEGTESILAERPYGVFSRQLFLGESLDIDNLAADYNAGVLAIKIPVAEQAKPRKVLVSGDGEERKQINA